MAERALGMKSQRLRGRLREVRERLVASGSGDAEEAAGRIDAALRVPV
jgi:hypothetical protein